MRRLMTLAALAAAGCGKLKVEDPAEALIGAKRKADQMASQLQLQDIAQAMNLAGGDFLSGRLPPAAILGKDGQPLLSWRVAILPEKDQQNLYNQFKLDEPWDSEHNKKLIAYMPKFYAIQQGSDAPDGYTHYRVIVTPQGKSPRSMFVEGDRRGPATSAVRDSASETFLVVEAEEAVPWTKPDELVFDPDGPLPKFGKFHKGGFSAVTVAGQVVAVPANTPEDALRAYITIDGGEVAPPLGSGSAFESKMPTLPTLPGR